MPATLRLRLTPYLRISLILALHLGVVIFIMLAPAGFYLLGHLSLVQTAIITWLLIIPVSTSQRPTARWMIGKPAAVKGLPTPLAVHLGALGLLVGMGVGTVTIACLAVNAGHAPLNDPVIIWMPCAITAITMGFMSSFIKMTMNAALEQ